MIKKRFFKLIEKYINEYKKPFFEEFYGKNSLIKVHNLSYSISTKSILVEYIIFLGGEINEDVIDRSMADYMIREACDVFFPECHIKTIARWDS